ncbi:hypothetical protein ACXWOG_11410, partial [Streptococcus pyogenes]
LNIISGFSDISTIDWQEITPDVNNDWLNQRDPNYQSYSSIVGDVFTNSAVGISTNRDWWVIGFNEKNTKANSKKL